MQYLRPTLFILLALLLAVPALPQVRDRDPLTQKEADDLADAKQDPDKRLDLFTRYARTRLLAFEQVLGDAKAEDRTQKLHDLMEDFTSIVDELSDNIDDYADKHDDIRKALKKVVDADTEFQIKLKAIKQDSATQKNNTSDYSFMLQNAIEAVDANAEDSRKVLEEQERIVKEAKEAEKLKKKKP